MNTTLDYIARVVIPASMAMLPSKMDSAEARAELIAIGLQESRFKHRRQVQGPALSFWQAESGGGFRGLLTHSATGELARGILRTMAYGEPDDSDFAAIEHNDILACIGARLLLWTHPGPLPRTAADGWAYYLATWRPGKPKAATWPEFYAQAWELLW